MFKISDLILTAKKIEEKAEEMKSVADYQKAAQARIFSLLMSNGMEKEAERSGLLYAMSKHVKE